MKTPVQVIDETIEIIQRDGHYKGDYVNSHTGQEVCMIGGMNRAMGIPTICVDGDSYQEDWVQEDEFNANGGWKVLIVAREAVVNHLPEMYSMIPSFNDDLATSVEDVLLLLKQARADLDTSGE